MHRLRIKILKRNFKGFVSFVGFPVIGFELSYFFCLVLQTNLNKTAVLVQNILSSEKHWEASYWASVLYDLEKFSFLFISFIILFSVTTQSFFFPFIFWFIQNRLIVLFNIWNALYFLLFSHSSKKYCKLLCKKKPTLEYGLYMRAKKMTHKIPKSKLISEKAPISVPYEKQ